jgi:hypothetical protein
LFANVVVVWLADTGSIFGKANASVMWWRVTLPVLPLNSLGERIGLAEMRVPVAAMVTTNALAAAQRAIAFAVGERRESGKRQSRTVNEEQLVEDWRIEELLAEELKGRTRGKDREKDRERMGIMMVTDEEEWTRDLVDSAALLRVGLAWRESEGKARRLQRRCGIAAQGGGVVTGALTGIAPAAKRLAATHAWADRAVGGCVVPVGPGDPVCGLDRGRRDGNGDEEAESVRPGSSRTTARRSC